MWSWCQWWWCQWWRRWWWRWRRWCWWWRWWRWWRWRWMRWWWWWRWWWRRQEWMMIWRDNFPDYPTPSCSQLSSAKSHNFCKLGFPIHPFRVSKCWRWTTWGIWWSMMMISQMHSFFQGFKLKMDDMGNILIKRLSKSPVYARNTLEVNNKINFTSIPLPFWCYS